jgi:hypothetical protein
VMGALFRSSSGMLILANHSSRHVYIMVMPGFGRSITITILPGLQCRGRLWSLRRECLI